MNRDISIALVLCGILVLIIMYAKIFEEIPQPSQSFCMELDMSRQYLTPTRRCVWVYTGSTERVGGPQPGAWLCDDGDVIIDDTGVRWPVQRGGDDEPK